MPHCGLCKRVAPCAVSARARSVCQRRHQIAITGAPLLIAKAQHTRGVFGHLVESGIVGLCQIDDLFVMAEIVVGEFRVPVEPERPHKKCVELPAQKVGHVERGEIIIGDFLEGGVALVEGKTMRAGYPLHTVLFANLVEHAASAAIGVADKDVAIAFILGLRDRGIHRRRDSVGIEMEIGRQAAQLHMLEPVALAHSQHLARNHAAGDDQQSVLTGDVGRGSCIFRLLRFHLSALRQGCHFINRDNSPKGRCRFVWSRSVIPSQHPELTVILPTFNEAGNIPVIVERIVAALGKTPCEIIVVDDDSADGTADVTRNLGEDYPNLRCIRRVGRRGLSGACVEGMMAASAPVVAVMDADLQHDETILPEMLNEIRTGADIVVATRYSGDGSTGGGLSSTREWGSKLATNLANRVTGELSSDPMSGFFMLRRDVADQVAGKVTHQGFKILFDILSRVEPGTEIREVPFTFRERHSGESKLDALVTVQFLGLLVSRLTGGLVPGQFLLFALVGFTGLFVHMAALFALTGILGVGFTYAQVGATLIAMTSNFVINNNLTFAHRKLKGTRWLLGLLSFYAVCSLGAIANVSVASHIYSWQTSIGLAGLAGALMSSVFNYSVTKLVTWRDV